MNGLRVLVADDHPVFRDGLLRLLTGRHGIAAVVTAATGRDALARIRDSAPDVAVLDLRLPDMDGIAVLESMQRERLPTRALIVSAYDDSATVYRAIASGARAYLPKATSGDTICDAVFAVARGDTMLPAGVQDSLASEIRMRRNVGDRPALSPRELDILRLAADGHPTAEIARQLHISAATVKTHLQHVFEKLEVSDRAAAVAQAMRRGLLH